MANGALHFQDLMLIANTYARTHTGTQASEND